MLELFIQNITTERRITMKRDKVPINIRVKQLFQFTSGYRKVEMIPRTEREKQIVRKTVFWILFCIIIIGLLGYFFYSFFINNIEIMLTAIVTIATTYFIVHQSKKVDYHKERLEQLPVIDLAVYNNKQYLSDLGENIEYIYEGHEYNSLLEITNIGKGIAFNVQSYGLTNDIEYTGYDNWDCTRLRNIKVNGNKIVGLNCECDVYKRFIIRFRFNDLFENRYQQDFTIKFEDNEKIQYIESGVPELQQRTHRFRYIQ